MADVRIKHEPTYLVYLSALEFHAVKRAVERVVAANSEPGDLDVSWRMHLGEVDRVLRDGPFPVDC